MTGRYPADVPGFEPGSVLAGYRLEAKVGEGGMAVVYRARDERLHRLVALKILAPEFTADTPFRQRFIRESEAAAAVDHPHIIPIYLAGDADGVLFIAMRFVSGGDLRQVMTREGPLSADRVAEIISPVASALDAAHLAGLVHRDVKPGNILVDTGPGRPDHMLLSDFGISKRVTTGGTLTGTGQFIGTAGYSAPEQIAERKVNGRADQYALACVTYELLTGETLFPRQSMYAVLIAHVHEQAPLLTSRRPDLPFAANNVMARALAKSPAERYPSCADFADALRAVFSLPPYNAGHAVLRPAPDQAPAQPSEPSGAERPGPEAPEAPSPPEVRTVTVASAAMIPQLPETRAGTALAPVPQEAAATQSTPAMPVAAMPATAPAEPAEAAEAPQEPEPADVADGGEAEAAGLAPTWPGADALADTDEFPAVEVGPDTDSDAGDGPESGAAPGPVAEPAPDVPDTAPPGPEIAVLGPPAAGQPPATDAGRHWRHRLPIVAGVAIVAGAAVTIPFIMNSAPGPTHPRHSASHPAAGPTPATPPRPSRIALPASMSDVAVSSVAFNPADSVLAIAGQSGTCLMRVATRNCASDVAGAVTVAFSHDGTILASSAGNGDIQLWHAATGRQILPKLTDPDSDGAQSVAFSPVRKTLAVGDVNGNTYLWNVAAKGLNPVALPDPGSSGVDAVAFSRDGTMLAAGDMNGSTYVWNVATKRLIATLPDTESKSTGGVWSVAFSPDGSTVAMGDSLGRSYLWNVKNKKLINSFSDTSGKGVRALAFSPNGRVLATGDHNGSTYLWSVRGKALICTLSSSHDDGVAAVAFSPDDRTLVTGNEDGTADFWPVGTLTSGH